MRRRTCECGCGERTPLASRTRRADGAVKGHPLRFVPGHQHRLANRTRWATDVPSWISKHGPLETPCHVWQRSVNSKGYGLVGVHGVARLAHRVAYENAYGPIPDGLEIHHQCENRRCVNPAHLWAVSSLVHHALHPRPRAHATHGGAS